MVIFEKPGKANTDEACRIALARAAALQCPIVAATTEGFAGARLCELAAEAGFAGSIVIVTHAYGTRAPGENALEEEYRQAILTHGAALVTAGHAFAGVERGISVKFQGLYPGEIMAETLKLFGQGTKVVVEIGCMALDAGAIPYGAPIVCMGGTGHGLDTAVVMEPAHSARIFETVVHEMLCKPY